MSDSQKVRFVGVYSDPARPEGVVMSRYTPNEPPETLTMYNFDTEERRECELLISQSTDGWVTAEEAEELVPELLEEIDGGDDE